MWARRNKCATLLQGSWLIYKARCRVAAMKEALKRERAFRERQRVCAIEMQRVVRGHLARVLIVRMKQYLRGMITTAKATLHVQTSVRKFLARKETERRRRRRLIQERWDAAIKIQKVFRGNRARHVFAIMMSLHALGAVEQAAAVCIQVGAAVYLFVCMCE